MKAFIEDLLTALFVIGVLYVIYMTEYWIGYVDLWF